MTLFFNIHTLEKEALHSPKYFVKLLRSLYYDKVPKSTAGFKVAKLKVLGTSFILNIEPLFEETVDIGFVIQYIRLAARRDYFMYKQYGIATLNKSYFPDLALNSIKHNPLLKIREDEIFFKYEHIRK